MHKLNLINNHTNFYFIGIGGINMSALAEILHKDGYTVSGSDKNDSDTCKHLRSLGITVHTGHNAQNLPHDAQVVVYNAAVATTNPERAEATTRGLVMLERAELLGLIMRNYKNAICVAGTHGKTTTTSMLAEIFIGANADPTVMSGGVLPSMGGAMRIGGEKYFIAEACEYHDSFLKFFPHIGIILNIEMDHGDYFDGEAGLRRSFRAFAEKIPQNGALIINEEVRNLHEITDDLKCQVITFGAHDLGYTLAVPGLHNVSNANAAVAVARHCGLGEDKITKALQGFTGAKRRFEKKGTYNGAQIIDDYAHHPTEVEATLNAAKSLAGTKRLWVAFQPHTHNRTSEFLNEFAKALEIADEIIVLDIYRPAGREEEQANIHAKDLVAKIYNSNCRYADSFEKAVEYAKKGLTPGDILITMGAGDVCLLSEMFCP
ncbi:MAG: UDP-N-acetylmuramate--L-alanine ligase [Defluviitaleaceae bacterium]|nr:UDP-N-acetylmuramate--L-alanine ligase [Defluviitaleaceae bacterium]